MSHGLSAPTITVFSDSLEKTNELLREIAGDLKNGAPLDSYPPDRLNPAAREFRRARARSEIPHGELAESHLVPLIGQGSTHHDFITIGKCPELADNPWVTDTTIDERHAVDEEELGRFRAIRKSEDHFLSQYYQPSCPYCRVLQGTPHHHDTIKSFHRYVPDDLFLPFENLEQVRRMLATAKAQQLYFAREIVRGRTMANPSEVNQVIATVSDLAKRKEQLKKEILQAARERDLQQHIILKRIKGDESLVEKVTYILLREALANKGIGKYRERKLDDILGFTIGGDLYGPGWRGDRDGNITATDWDETPSLEKYLQERGCETVEPPTPKFKTSYRGFHTVIRYQGNIMEVQIARLEDIAFNEQTHKEYKSRVRRIEDESDAHGLPVSLLKNILRGILDLRYSKQSRE